MKNLFSFILVLLAIPMCGKTHDLRSPNKRLQVEVVSGKTLSWRILHDGREVMRPSEIDICNAYQGKASGSKTKHYKSSFPTPFYRQSNVTAEYNEMSLSLGKGWTVVFRAFDEGVAYRFICNGKVPETISDEKAEFRFNGDSQSWLSFTTNDKKPEAMAFQNIYDQKPLKEAAEKLAFLPATVENGGVKLTILESDLKAYPGMFVKKGSDGESLNAWFARYPKTFEKYPWRQQRYVTSTEDYIARTNGKLFQTPWRIVAVTEKDTEMPVNNLVYALAEPAKTTDTSWIKPGKVAWDWWNDWNLKGVDFKAGINFETYKYYIDFAAKNNIEYVVLDEGWYESKKGDIMNPIPEIRLPELIAYAKSKGVDIVLWTVFNVLDEHLDEAMAKYKAMGAKGFKIDFLDRDDQEAVELAYRIAEAALRHQLVLDYHGYYKPTGMSRTFPNILNYEGVFGMEEARWTELANDMPLYDVTFPYIRMMAGRVDFTPGAMRNGTKDNWKAIYTAPVSMGTRCHQLACYIVHDSPFTMLCDAPTNYEREQECVDMIASLPTVFDRTIIPQGELGKYIVTAREKDGNWYVAGQTNWDSRTITLKFDFLPKGKKFHATIFRDGVNANHNAEDYKREEKEIDSTSVIDINMASGGGVVMELKIKN
ncbi:MAG: glycoside hydrolase family 97 protein [Prevotella sp.]